MYIALGAQSASAFGCQPKSWWIKPTQEREQNLRMRDFCKKNEQLVIRFRIQSFEFLYLKD